MEAPQEVGALDHLTEVKETMEVQGPAMEVKQIMVVQGRVMEGKETMEV